MNDAPENDARAATDRVDNPQSETDQPESINLDAPDLYTNRELSLLEFQRRVLDLGLQPDTPLLERVKYLGIVSSNLDEFFMVRVAGLIEQRLTGTSKPGADGLSVSRLLADIRQTVSEITAKQREVWHQDIRPGLAEAGIEFVPYSSLESEARESLRRLFEREIYPVLTPQAVDEARPFPHISSLSLNMLIVVQDELGEHVARLKIPPIIERFVEVPSTESSIPNGVEHFRFVLVEEVIEANLDVLFPGKEIKNVYMFRLTRDADYELRDSTAETIMQAVEAELEQRLFGFVVRLSVEPAMPFEWRDWLAEQLDLSVGEIFVMDRPLGLSDLMELVSIDRPDLKFPSFTPRIPQWYQETGSIFDVLQRRDIMLYHPYDSFTPVIDLVRQASSDPDVVAIKQTLYRIGNASPIVDALLEARDDEKQVAVLVELKARFDEESNIRWARALESAGVHVAYGVSFGMKTHCKLTLVVRREGGRLRRYVHLGTGNYNPVTARLYTDLSFMTCDDDIAADVSDIFNYLTGYSAQQQYRKLLVAPVTLRRRMTELIRNEAKHGSEGHIMMKMNQMIDLPMIQELYRASQAGVRIDLLVRGFCSLRPGIPGVSENIRVVSILGRFLEHARAYYFRHGAEDSGEYVIAGSADLMPRNLNYRVEAMFPIEDPNLLAYVRDDMLRYQLRATVNAYELEPDGSYRKIEPTPGEPPHDAQYLPGPPIPDALRRAVPAIPRG
ncbi:polyphosphate kinase 1 [soil metagenome]